MDLFTSIIVWAGIAITVLTGIPVFYQLLKTHPKGLIVLFFAEMWERFSYYGMRGLFVFYLTQHFLFEDKFASGQYGAYTSLVYLVPLVGGFLADRYLGTRKAVTFGAILLVFGQLGMAFGGEPSKQFIDYTSPAGVHQTYAVSVSDGRLGKTTMLNVDGKTYEMGANDKGDLQIKNLPANASIPATVPANAFKKRTEKNPIFLGAMYLALSLIIMGVGFLKANISTIVGQLYPQGDPRRDPGFTLYYYGVNLGAFWAAILCSWFGQHWGWGWGFGSAGVGMLLGLVVFVIGKPLLQGKAEPRNPEVLKEKVFGIGREALIYIAGFVGVAVIWGMLRTDGAVRDLIAQTMAATHGPAPLWLSAADFFSFIGAILVIASLGMLAFIAWFMTTKCTKIERERLGLALVLLVGCVVFFALFEQAGSSLNLFADRNTDLNFIHAPVRFALGNTKVVLASADQLAAAHIDKSTVFWIDAGMTPAQAQTFNAGFILVFAPVFAALWTWLGRIKKDPGPMVKFGLGLMQVGLGFMLLVWGSQFHDAAYRLPVYFLAGAYLLHTTGELFLSPVGLSEITKLAPLTIMSTMMATWFLATAWGQWLAAFFASTASAETVGGQVLDPAKALQTSLDVFTKIGIMGIAVGVGFLILAPFITKWGHGHADPEANKSGLTDRMQEL
ncbi:MAG TPA: MFS transporter [Caulobacteraceae bacterium]|jgi:POT family proton-dependent oligopeptide transporter|nr:MFS transporter [Caulobacteraceae bacterium]